MTSIPTSRSARAMIFAPRSCPSRPGFAITTLIFRAMPRSLKPRSHSTLGTDKRELPLHSLVEMAFLGRDVLPFLSPRPSKGHPDEPPLHQSFVRQAQQSRGWSERPPSDVGRFARAVRLDQANVADRLNAQDPAPCAHHAHLRTCERALRLSAVTRVAGARVSADLFAGIDTAQRHDPCDPVHNCRKNTSVDEANNYRLHRAEGGGPNSFSQLRSGATHILDGRSGVCPSLVCGADQGKPKGCRRRRRRDTRGQHAARPDES